MSIYNGRKDYMNSSIITVTSPFLPNQVIVCEGDDIIPKVSKVDATDDVRNELPKQNGVTSKEVETQKNVKNGKKRRRKSEVFSFSVEDASKILNYFADRNEWLHYMLFVISCNIARRNGDILSLTWEDFFNPKTGKFRQELSEIEEEKTKKIANPHINSAVKSAIEIYLEKTGYDPAEDNYTTPICMQLSGTHKGTVLTYDGCRKGIKRAAAAVGIEYNVGTHSARKTFGAMSRMIHPGDHDSMELLQTIYNHSDAKTTKRYIGLTKQMVDKYYDDMGEFFEEYITGDKTYQSVSDKPIISLGMNDLRDIITAAYKAGQDNAGKSDAMVHIEAINEIMAMIESLSK